MYPITLENIIHVHVQNSIQPNSIDEKLKMPSKYVADVTYHHSKIIPSITRNKATAVPSLNKLSHSNIMVSLLGAHIDLKIESTATGSVADIRIQKRRHTKNGICSPTKGSNIYSKNATIIADNNNHTIARMPIVFQFFKS